MFELSHRGRSAGGGARALWVEVGLMNQDMSVWSLLENSWQFWLDVWRQKGGVIVLVANITCVPDAGVRGWGCGWETQVGSRIPGWEARMQWSVSVGVCVWPWAGGEGVLGLGSG